MQGAGSGSCVSRCVVVRGTASCTDNGEGGGETRARGVINVLLCLTLWCCYRYGKQCKQRMGGGGGGDTCTGRGQCHVSRCVVVTGTANCADSGWVAETRARGVVSVMSHAVLLLQVRQTVQTAGGGRRHVHGAGPVCGSLGVLVPSAWEVCV